MAFDAHKNLAISAVVAPAPGAAGVSLTVTPGEGARFPAAPFSATVWPAAEMPNPANAEVVRVTAIAADTLTITRAQEGTTARAIVAGDLFAATITVKALTDIESGVNFPQITTPGQVIAANLVAIPTGLIYWSDKTIMAAPVDGTIRLTNYAMNDFGRLQFGGTTSAYPALKRSGAGLAVRTADDGGPADLSVAALSLTGQLLLTGPPPNAPVIRPNTTDGADTSAVFVSGGGDVGDTRGSRIGVFGNEYPGVGGLISFVAGNTPTGAIDFYTGPTAHRGRIHPTGGFSWGGTTDPGGAVISVAPGGYADGAAYTNISAGLIQYGGVGSGANFPAIFKNASGQCGFIQTTGANTSYNTTSDARLKTDRGRHTDPEVLRKTIIHDFVWNTDGTPGRGVFAQEAALVAPFAVSVGTDDVDDQGRLTKPWGVDYSKYVPDLIAGWQSHDVVLEQLRADVVAQSQHMAALYSRVIDLSTQAERPTLINRVRTAWRSLWNAWKPSWV